MSDAQVSRTQVSTSTRSRDFQRNGGERWLCGDGPASILAIAHQVSAANTDGVSK